MGTLTKNNPDACEFVTAILTEELWWLVLKLIVEFLRARAVQQVRLEFGFILARDLSGKPQVPSRTVKLDAVEPSIRAAFERGTIEWRKLSDFCFYPLGADVAFMLCNDADVHFASANLSVLTEIADSIRSAGIKVYDSARSI
jgi:hypothetical protein